MEGYQKTDLTLYTYFRSSTSWRVRILLHHKKLGVNYKFIKLSAGEQKSEEFAKVNPNQVNLSLFRVFLLLSCPLETSLLNLLPSSNILKRFIQKNHCCLKTPSKRLRLEDSVRSLTQQFIPIKTSECSAKLSPKDWTR